MKNQNQLTKVRKQRAKVINSHIRKLSTAQLNYEPTQVRLLTFYSENNTYATVLLKLDASISLNSQALGHADTRTTQVYHDCFSNEEIDKANEEI